MAVYGKGGREKGVGDVAENDGEDGLEEV